MMELLIILECSKLAPGRKMNQKHFATNLNKVRTTLSKEEDEDENNDHIGDTCGQSDDIANTVAELTREKEGNVES